jgi:tetratricopeptide (TPR) repeat protein
MKLLASLTITLALAAPVLAQTPAPVSSAAEAQAKLELNEAARAYREGRFAEAQAHSQRALLLDPQNKSAPMFVARTIHAQYKPGDFTAENVAKARETIIAYQRILDREPEHDEAYKAIAYLYGALKEDQLQREWILRRAGDISMPNDKRAEAFVALASNDWDCSFQITKLPSHKVTTIVRNKPSISYKMPKERVDFERAQECANRGLEMVNMAIALTPENESAWAHRANILLELSKLAEMLGEELSKRELLRQYDEALKQTTKLSNRSEPNP